MSVKSCLPSICFSVGASGMYFASFETFFGNEVGISKLLAMDSISTYGSSGNPRISTISPSGFLSFSAHFLIFATTFCPSSAPFISSPLINISVPTFLSSGTTNPKSLELWNVPTNLVAFLFIILRIFPSRFSPELTLSIFTRTVSLLTVEPMNSDGINTSSPSSISRNPNPFSFFAISPTA